MTFLEHLEELRKRIFISFLVILGGVVPAWFLSKKLYAVLSQPLTQYLPEGTKLVFTKLTEPFLVYMKIAFFAAIFFTAPILFYQVWKFISPGLYKKEKKYVWPFVFFSTLFFTGGALFGYYVVFPWACRFFISIGSDFQSMIVINDFLNFTLKFLLGIALVFEMPTLVFFLAKLGIVSARGMVRKFKYAVLIIFIVAAVITPSPDMISQVVLAVPMLGLYGLSILIAWVVGKKKKEKTEESPSG
ncbi:MAG: twin arginine-targeting protein translocase TatC [Candidatus Aminicenantes bacterium RBG_13_62_12]|nr:MAG: twin arginine-targeting protein translocase TatC [Candidatus Aminicenantes bacterium RBG_13_62_12]